MSEAQFRRTEAKRHWLRPPFALIRKRARSGVRRDSGWSLYNREALPASPSSFQAPDDNCQIVDQQLRIPSFRYKIGTTEREKKRYAAP
jgi:hypothetical protein